MPAPLLCCYHRTGVPAGAPPFYKPGCHRCEAKRAAGVVTEDTPPPPDRHLEHGRVLARTSVAEARARKVVVPRWEP